MFEENQKQHSTYRKDAFDFFLNRICHMHPMAEFLHGLPLNIRKIYNYQPSCLRYIHVGQR